jgi:HSP20 family protein
VSDYFEADARDIAGEAHELLLELDRRLPGVAAVSGECRPAVDVIETARAVEVVVDLPGVPTESIRVALRRHVLLIVGAKLAAPIDPTARFHVAERSYGRFARAVRITGAFDGSRASASAGSGQLRVVLPRVEDRRGQVVMVPVTTR